MLKLATAPEDLVWANDLASFFGGLFSPILGAIALFMAVKYIIASDSRNAHKLHKLVGWVALVFATLALNVPGFVGWLVLDLGIAPWSWYSAAVLFSALIWIPAYGFAAAALVLAVVTRPAPIKQDVGQIPWPVR